MADITPFDFHGHQVRVLTAEDGEPRWVAADVAKILGYRSAPEISRFVRDRHKGVEILDTPGGPQRMTVLTEAGLYAAIMKSRAAGAAEFQDWVTDEVLPAIRRHGGYLTPEKTEEFLTDPDTIIQLATNLKEERARREVVERKNVALDKWKRATEAGDGLKLTDFRDKYFTSVPKMTFFQHLYESHWIKNEHGWRQHADGSPKDGPNHMAPLRKANGVLYRHDNGSHGGKKRLQTRVKPDAEIVFRDALIKEGLTPNEHSTGLVLITNEDLKELGA